MFFDTFCQCRSWRAPCREIARTEIQMEKVNQAKDIMGHDKKTETESHQTRSLELCMGPENIVERTPKQRGVESCRAVIINAPMLSGKEKTTTFCCIVFYQNSFRNRLKKFWSNSSMKIGYQFL